MGLPNSVAREPLLRYLRVQQLSDAEMRLILRDAAREAKAILSRTSGGTGAAVRRAQLDVARSQQLMWRRVGFQARVGIGDGVDAAADSLAYLTEIQMQSVGISATGLRQSLLETGRAGIDLLLSRSANQVPLSQSVYRTSVASGERLDRMVNAMLVNGASAKEIAQAAYKFIDPLTPGGASYAAMRLGRTELNNAFHTTTVRMAADLPFVGALKWNLSGSHPEPDECNDYAEQPHIRNGEAGVFKVDEVPAKPHPNCLCYTTPVVDDDDEFVRKFNAGQYDSWIDDQLGGARA